MTQQTIIAIGREYGSAGHEIAEKIADDLGIALYDRRLLDELAQKYGMDPKVLEKMEESPRNHLLSRKVKGYSNSLADAVSELQFNFIKEKADAGESFVIVGRCAEIVLKDYKCMTSVFVLGDYDSKLKRIMDKYNLNKDEASQKMARHDRKRKAYHNAYSKYHWGDSRGYDLCVNSSHFGIEATAKLIEGFVASKM